MVQLSPTAAPGFTVRFTLMYPVTSLAPYRKHLSLSMLPPIPLLLVS